MARPATKAETIVLATFTDISAAKIAQAKLEGNGIKSFLNDENVLGLDPVGGVELKIFEKDKSAAQDVIANQ